MVLVRVVVVDDSVEVVSVGGGEVVLSPVVVVVDSVEDGEIGVVVVSIVVESP